MDGLLWIEFRFVLTGSFNVFVEESYEGWHGGVSEPNSSAEWGRQSYTAWCNMAYCCDITIIRDIFVVFM